jgi:hypothetical protein
VRFESEYDSDEFELKIRGIVRSIQRAQARDKSEEAKWNNAIALLRNEDHYILILIDSSESARPRGDFIKLVLTALAIVFVALIGVLYLANRRQASAVIHSYSRDNSIDAIWSICYI